MANVQDVARLFIDLAEKEYANKQGDRMTNLRLQKLLYFAQGYYLARRGEPLFPDEIEAWRFGPVVPAMYNAYQGFSGNGITDEPPAEGAFTSEEYSFLLDFIREYWKYSANEMIRMSHEAGTPWFEVYDENRRHIVMPKESIRNYFEKKDRIEPFESIFRKAVEKIPVISPSGYTESGAAVFPKTAAGDWGDWDE